MARHVGNVFVCYDGDDAGRHGAKRAVNLIKSYGCNAVNVPLIGDPDDFVFKYGLEEFIKLCATAYQNTHQLSI